VEKGLGNFRLRYRNRINNKKVEKKETIHQTDRRNGSECQPFNGSP